MLSNKGTEFEITPGLNLLNGTAKIIASVEEGLRLPHVGWTKVNRVSDKYDWLFEGIEDESKFYFIHSYCIEPDTCHTIGVSSYANNSFASVIGCGGIIGTQFHPEKSGPQGLRLIFNFSKFHIL